MNILITGATGFIGKYLTQRLIEDKHNLFALVRKTSQIDFLKSLGVNLIYGDITDEKSLCCVLRYHVEAVFHCAAYVEDNDWKKLFQVNVIGTENICNLCLKLNVQRLVYLSSVAVISGNDNVPLREDLPYRVTNLYGASKLDAEKKVIEFREKGLKAAIIRPPMVYGEGEPHALGKMLFLIKHRLLPLVGGGKAKWHLAYVKNVVEGLVLALHKDECLEGAFFVADQEVLTIKEVFLILSKVINAPLPYVLPAWSTRFLLNIPYLGPKAQFFLKDRIYDITRIKALGYKPRYDARDSLARSAYYWLKEKQNLQKT